jgi:hypothetical protein
MSVHKKKRGGVLSEAFEVMGLPLRFATEVVDDFISDTVSFIDPRRDKKGRKHVSTNY